MAAVTGATEHRLRNGPVELNYAEIPGDGPKVLLLHGLTARWQVFAPLIRGLRKHARLYALDFRGHGGSGRAPGRYLLADYVADARTLLHRMGGAAVVYGHSMGGWVALALAAERPDAVGGVVVAESALFPERLGPDRDDLARLPVTLRSMTTSLGRLDPEVLNGFRTRAAQDFDPRTVLPGVTCPVLLLQGDGEAGGLMTDDDVRDGAALLPRPSHARFAGLGHGLHVEDAGRVLGAVVPFIQNSSEHHHRGRRSTGMDDSRHDDTRHNKELVQSFFDEVWNKGDFAYMDDIYTTDFKLNALWENTSLGRSGTAAKNEARTTIEGWLDAFPDMRVTVEEQVADGDFVASRHIAVGTQAKEFRGLPNTGRRGAITGMTINRISGDRIAEVWTCWDAAGMMQQLGIFPGPDPEISTEETAGIWAAFPAAPHDGSDAKAVVARLYGELWSEGDLGLAKELIDDDYLGHASGRPLARGPEGIAGLAAEWRAGVPDLKFEIHAQHAEGSRCVTRLTASGTHEGDWLGIPATGKVLRLSGLSVARVAGGKVVSEWSEFDAMGLLGQLS